MGDMPRTPGDADRPNIAQRLANVDRAGGQGRRGRKAPHHASTPARRNSTIVSIEQRNCTSLLPGTLRRDERCMQ